MPNPQPSAKLSAARGRHLLDIADPANLARNADEMPGRIPENGMPCELHKISFLDKPIKSLFYILVRIESRITNANQARIVEILIGLCRGYFVCFAYLEPTKQNEFHEQAGPSEFT